MKEKASRKRRGIVVHHLAIRMTSSSIEFYIFTGLHGYEIMPGLSTNEQRHRLQLLKTGGYMLHEPGRINKRAAHSEKFLGGLGGLVCTRNLAFRLQ